MVIWGLDLATNLGECWGEPDALPTLGHHRLPSTGSDVGEYLCAYREWMTGRLIEVKPGFVAFEAPILPKVTQITTVRKLTGLANVTEMVCHDHKIPCGEATTSQVKKALTGNGRAEKWHMVRACRAYGLDPVTYPKDGMEASDEADGFGVWIATVREIAPEHSARWILPMQVAPLFAGAQA